MFDFMKIKRTEEYNLSTKVEKEIISLLKDCFSSYPDQKSYYKQIPSFRFLAYDEKNLVGHLAIHFRTMNIGGLTTKIFGISDLCVASTHRSKNIASSLLNELETLGVKSHIDFLILVAQDHGLYKKNSFQLVDNTCRWLLINGNQSLGVMHGQIERSIMMKQIGEEKWRDGILDFLGPVF